MVFAQSGTKVFPFLHIPSGARASALGGETIGIRDGDPSGIDQNPSLMNTSMDNVLSVQFTSYLAGSRIGNLTYVKEIGEEMQGGIFVKYMDYGTMPRTDAEGNVFGDFSAIDAQAGLSYAYRFEENFSIGGNISFITSRIDTFTSQAIAGNLAVSYFIEEDILGDSRDQNLSLVFRNLGTQLKTFDGLRERLPIRVDLAYSRTLEHLPLRIHMVAHNLQQVNISSPTDSYARQTGILRKIADHLSMGFELFPDRSFQIRAGYNFKRSNELEIPEQRNFAGLGIGFGIRTQRFHLDYAFSRYHQAGTIHQLGVVFNLNNF